MTTIFSSNWEASGGSDVTDGGLWTGSNGPPTISSSVKYGSYSLQTTAAQYANSKVYKTLGSTYSEGYLQFRIYFNTLPADGDYIVFARYVSSSGQIMRLVLSRSGSTYILTVENIANSTNYQYVWNGFAAETWYKIEWHAIIHGSTGATTVYIDDSIVLNRTGIDTDIASGANINELDVGIYSNTYAASNITVYYDDVVFADAYLGGVADPKVLELGTNTSGTGNATSLSFSHTLVTGTNRVVVVDVGIENAADIDVSGITYGGVAMTKAKDQSTAASGTRNIAESWYLLEADLPSEGSNTVAITCSGSASSLEINGWCSELGNIAQSAPEATDGDSQTSGNTITSTISPSTDAWVVSVLSCGNAGSFTHGSGQIEKLDFNDASSQFSVAVLQGGNGESSLASTFSGTVNRLVRVAVSFARYETPAATGMELYCLLNEMGY